MEDIVINYQHKEIEELQKIEPLWACGKHIGKSQWTFKNLLNEDYRVFLLNPYELINHADFSEVNPKILFTGNSTNDRRVARILSRWESKGFLDPPAVYLSNGTLSFTDGRHRAKIAYILKHKFMPVAVHPEDIDIISKLIELKPLEKKLTSYDNNRFK